MNTAHPTTLPFIMTLIKDNKTIIVSREMIDMTLQKLANEPFLALDRHQSTQKLNVA